MDGSQTIGELRELIADQARLPPQALVFYTPQLMHTDAAAASSFAARGVADSIPLAEALKGTDHRIDVHVGECRPIWAECFKRTSRPAPLPATRALQQSTMPPVSAGCWPQLTLLAKSAASCR